MVRRLLALAGAVGLAAMLAAPVQGSATSSTVTFHDAVIPISDPANPCAAAVGWSLNTNGVLHESVASNGSFHFTGTFTADFVVTVLPSEREATGHYTVWFGGNENVVTAEDGTMILFWETFAAYGSYTDDGSRLQINFVEQLRIAPDGACASSRPGSLRSRRVRAWFFSTLLISSRLRPRPPGSHPCRG